MLCLNLVFLTATLICYMWCYFTWACFLPLDLVWVPCALDCHFVQLGIIMCWLFELTRGGICSLWIMKLWSWMWFIEVWTWCSCLQLDWIHFNISYLSLPPSLYLIWVAIVLDCNFIQLDIIVLLLFELTRGGIISLWIMKLWSCMWVIQND